MNLLLALKALPMEKRILFIINAILFGLFILYAGTAIVELILLYRTDFNNLPLPEISLRNSSNDLFTYTKELSLMEAWTSLRQICMRFASLAVILNARLITFIWKSSSTGYLSKASPIIKSTCFLVGWYLIWNYLCRMDEILMGIPNIKSNYKSALYSLGRTVAFAVIWSLIAHPVLSKFRPTLAFSILAVFLFILQAIRYESLMLPLYASKYVPNTVKTAAMINLTETQGLSKLALRVLSESASRTFTEAKSLYAKGMYGEILGISEDIIEKYPTNMITAITAHELGHRYYSDYVYNAVLFLSGDLSSLAIGTLLVLPSTVFAALSLNNASPIVALAMGDFLYKIIKYFTRPIDNLVSQIVEKRADLFAKQLGYGIDLAKYCVLFTSHTMTSLYSLLYNSHPSATTRARYLVS